MPGLAELQSEVRRAVVLGETTGIACALAGGRDVLARLEIHRRHYETSLVSALLGKFPASVWLAGQSFVADAARRYIRQFPPQAPCVAEYGETFPGFLAASAGAERMAYLRQFAELEWHVGHVSIAADEPAVPLQQLAAIPVDALPKMRLTLQLGLRYCTGGWPVDELLRLYLTETAPDRLEFEAASVWLEIRGSRGEFDILRLDAAEYAFRESLQRGRPVGDAIENALAVDGSFEPDQALLGLVTSQSITAMEPRGNQ